MKTILLLFGAALCLYSCTIPQIAVAPELKENTSFYPAKGKNGWQVNQVISFGDFETSKIKRGWTFSYNIPFILQFSGAKEKMEFQQLDSAGNSAMIFTINKFQSTELSLVNDYFHVPIKHKDYFAGTISLNTSLEVWDFIIYNPDGGAIKNTTEGYLKNGDKIIQIKGVQDIENQKVQLNKNAIGFQFYSENTPIAAVSILNNGHVWMKNSLDNNSKLLIASISSALLARYNIEEKAEAEAELF